MATLAFAFVVNAGWVSGEDDTSIQGTGAWSNYKFLPVKEGSGSYDLFNPAGTRIGTVVSSRGQWVISWSNGQTTTESNSDLPFLSQRAESPRQTSPPAPDTEKNTPSVTPALSRSIQTITKATTDNRYAQMMELNSRGWLKQDLDGLANTVQISETKVSDIQAAVNANNAPRLKSLLQSTSNDLATLKTKANRRVEYLNGEITTMQKTLTANTEEISRLDGMNTIGVGKMVDGKFEAYGTVTYDPKTNKFTSSNTNIGEVKMREYDDAVASRREILNQFKGTDEIAPETQLARYNALSAKEKTGDLTPDEIKEFASLKNEREKNLAAADAAKSGGVGSGLSSWAKTAGNGIMTGFKSAVAVMGFIGMIGPLIDKGEHPEVVASLTLAAGAAAFTGPAVYGMLGGETGEGADFSWGKGVIAGAAAIYVGLLTYQQTYEETETVQVQFLCQDWKPPIGGSNCDSCNNPDKPCSRYRCKALGEGCDIINEGTGSEMCIWKNPSDTSSPGIKPDYEILTNGYDYDDVTPRPPGGSGPAGMKVVKKGGGCVEAFTPITFGIETSEPAQCKIDVQHRDNYDEMQYYVGGDNLYLTNHSQLVSLPSPESINSSNGGQLTVENDGKYSWYIRCRDGNGNTNVDEFAIQFCVDPGPDLTAPRVISTNPTNPAPVLYNVDNMTAEFYINEPANCRWSRKDSSYENMENQMTCSDRVFEMNAQMLYTCSSRLTGIVDDEENTFYIRCMDISPQQNKMQQSYIYTVFGTQPLDIIKVGPNGTIGGSTSTITATLEVRTDNGYRNGESICYWSETGANEDYIEFANTGQRNIHTQDLDFISGDYIYYFKCVDAGGNTAYNQTDFSIFVDKYAPIVIRAYNEVDKLKIITDEDSSCGFSTETCNFELDEALANPTTTLPYGDTQEHYQSWQIDQTYYIKCKDQYDNEPNPSECSIIIRPYSTEF